MQPDNSPNAHGSGGTWRFGEFTLDASAGELFQGARRVPLQEKPLQVLTLLLERAGQVVGREELRQRLWAVDTFVDFDRNLNTAVKKVRAALGDDADAPRFVETIPRRGYRFLARVSLVAPSSATPSAPSEPTLGSAQAEIRAPGSSRATQVAALPYRSAVAPLALAAVLLAAVMAPSRTLAPALRESATPVVAVLPLKHENKSQHQISAGIAEEMVRNLSNNDGEVHVVASRALGKLACSSKGAGASTAELGRELGVSHLVEGSVRQQAEGLRITMQLVRVSDQRLVASEFVDVPANEVNLPEAEAAVARQLMEMVKRSLRPASKS